MKRILITDDVEGWVNFHTNIIKSIFDEVFIDSANSAGEAYNKILENNNTPYDIIITDLQMEDDFTPKLAGEWLVESVKNLPKYYKTTIIIISASYNIKMIADNWGVHYIPKADARNSIDAYKKCLEII